MRTTIISLFLAVITLSSGAALAASLPPGGTFTDDDQNIHEGTIEAIAAEGITKGCNPPWNDSYCPGQNVTRGEVAAMISRAFGLTDTGGKDWFSDDDGRWYEADANKLAAAGITKGCNPPDNDRFCGDSSLSRGQFAAFLVRAYGYTDPGPGNWFTDDDTSIFENDIDRLAQAGVTKGCNPPANTHFCPLGTVKRDQLASFLARAEGLAAMVPPVRPDVALETVVSGLSQPLFLTSPAGDDRQFVVEKGGRVRIIDDDAISGTFLDIGSLVSKGSEQGLLGLAFHPDYGSNGLFYVAYTDSGGALRVAEYEVSGDPDAADSGSARNIITIGQPSTNHNGGGIAFDPDGMLLIGVGDGGGSGDPADNGENPKTLLGALLRIDVDSDDFPGSSTKNYAIPSDNPFVGTSAGADEVWAYGLRNPWRFSIDPATDLLYIADVGQQQWEEVNVAAVDEAGLNYGWNVLEGTHCYEPSSGCSSAGTTLPIYEYGHGQGCSITGGYVYRDDEVTQLIGHYVYADFCTGVIRSFRYAPGVGVDSPKTWNELGSVGQVYSFGVDASDRLYVLAGDSVLRFTTD